ncbi:MAG: NUDIX hydrolase [Gammaproteobacteria bacterium]
MFRPNATVAAIIERDKRFLMVRETIDGRPTLNQPAGHLEDDESLLDAVVREVREETAWSFTPQGLVGVYRWRHPNGAPTFLRFVFFGEVAGFDADRPLDADIDETLWLDLETLQRRVSEMRSPLVMRGLKDYLDGRRFPLDLLTDL